ncbi:MAG: DUF3846 domain-containing protein [Oscillospiraceae bacterium]|nr:DUF3846 domain-containing protein [Oscillospiraceae bacterium]
MNTDIKYSVIIKRPGEPPRHVNMSLKIENLQRYVGGYIETVTIGTDWCVICDEEGRLKGKPHNCTVCNIDFVGDIVFVGVDGDELTDFPITFKDFKHAFPKLWEVQP